jgi:hypothetical protein
MAKAILALPERGGDTGERREPAIPRDAVFGPRPDDDDVVLALDEDVHAERAPEPLLSPGGHRRLGGPLEDHPEELRVVLAINVTDARCRLRRQAPKGRSQLA